MGVWGQTRRRPFSAFDSGLSTEKLISNSSAFSKTNAGASGRSTMKYDRIVHERLKRKHASQKKNIVIVGSLIALTFLIMGVIGYMTNIVFSVMVLTTGQIKETRGLLYPFESETREVRTLDGKWNFLKSNSNDPMEGVKQKWFAKSLQDVGDTIVMPVPASYNDITEDSTLRDHVGTVWYDRTFFVPKSWKGDGLVWIRFGSVHYAAIVWINGIKVVEHQIGHLPFEAEVSEQLKFGGENRITVLVDNTLIATTIPQGHVSEIQTDNGMEKTQSYTFDFFNYAGIHRSVHLFRTPKIHIEDVVLHTEVSDKGEGVLSYTIITTAEEGDQIQIEISIFDKQGVKVATVPGSSNVEGKVSVPNANLWWPYLMHPEPGYMYQLEIKLSAPGEPLLDVYRMKFGFRTLAWNEKEMLINGKPIYFRGFGRHEDSDIRGKGLDYALLTKDFNLLRWIGANAYRTSHYPYSEESMQFADETGIMIVDECPSVDTDDFSLVLLQNHKSSLQQLIHRDRNHPSVVMWSVANEPRTGKLQADAYFKEIADFTRSLDRTRPVTAVIAVGVGQDKAAQHMDIVSFNRYNAWYQNPGQLNTVTISVVQEATAWHERHKKPVIMSEYGADTLEGLHMLPAFIWSEEYQKEILSRHFKAFDTLRDLGFFIGEFIWNFADFKTAQTYTRVGGNKKGIFLRNRQPKDSAFLVRKRYYALANVLDNLEDLPGDLGYYVGPDKNITRTHRYATSASSGHGRKANWME